MSRQISQDRSSFEDREVVPIVVDDGWDAAVGRVFCEPWLFLDVVHDVDTLVDIIFAVCFFQFLEEDRGFVAVGRAECEELDARLGWMMDGLSVSSLRGYLRS